MTNPIPLRSRVLARQIRNLRGELKVLTDAHNACCGEYARMSDTDKNALIGRQTKHMADHLGIAVSHITIAIARINACLEETT